MVLMQKTISSRLVLLLSAGVLALSSLLIGPMFASAHGDEANKVGPHAVGSTLEVRIADDNSVTVRGAKVTAVSGSVITAQTSFGSTVLSWSIRTNADTRFAYRSDSSAALAAIIPGDYVSFSGMLNTSVSGLTVDAKLVKDWSRPTAEDSRAFAGTIQSVDAANMKFTLATGGAEGVITVKLASTVAITNGQAALAFGNILVGDKASVKGTYDASAKLFTATKVNIERKNADGHKIFNGVFQALKDRLQLHFSFRK